MDKNYFLKHIAILKKSRDLLEPKDGNGIYYVKNEKLIMRLRVLMAYDFAILMIGDQIAELSNSN